MDKFSLTRYLYSTVEVKQSLLMALLDRELDEALFWTFELFYTDDFICGELVGTSTFEYVCSLYEQFYKSHNSDIESWINTKLSLAEPDVAVASLVQTLIPRQYCIVDFVETYLHVKCSSTCASAIANASTCTSAIASTKHKKLRIMLSKENIKKYSTIVSYDSVSYDSVSYDSPRTILKKACRFPIRKNMNVLFNTFIPGSMVQIWREHWLYYAARSAIWEQRIIEFDGSLNEDTLSVDFDDEDYHDNDMTAHELFYNQWNYEPDEQSLDLRNRIIGPELDNAIQLDVRAFCEKYGAHIPMRKLKIKK